MLRKILLVLLLALIALIVFVAMQPAAFRIARKTVVAAPPAAVFARVDDLHLWQDWSPWAKLDPAAKNTFSGAEKGTGAVFTWEGNNEVGKGTMTIEESVAPQRLRIRLDFERPMKAVNHAHFTFTPEGNGTSVEWAMTGTNSFVGKAFGLVVDVDAMLGAQFDQGLTQLKSLVEAGK